MCVVVLEQEERKERKEQTEKTPRTGNGPEDGVTLIISCITQVGAVFCLIIQNPWGAFRRGGLIPALAGSAHARITDDVLK